MDCVDELVGERLAGLRKERGLSQTELGRISSLNTSTINRIERGQIPNPSGETLRRLAYALRVETSDLMPTMTPNDAARLMPRTVQAIPSDAPALLMEIVDRQVAGIVRLIFQGARRSGPESDGNDDEPEDGYGCVISSLRTSDRTLIPA